MSEKDSLKILEHFLKLRPKKIPDKNINKLNTDQKSELSKDIRVWGYINALSREIAKELNLNLNNINSLLKGSILIHMSIFDYTDKTTYKIYQDVFKQINENKVWKESFASSAKDAQLDMLDYKNNIIVNENTNLPRFDLFIWGCIERFKIS